MLSSSGRVYASRSTVCCLYTACRSATTTLLSSRRNSTEKNACPANRIGTGDRLLRRRDFTVLSTGRVLELPTTIVKRGLLRTSSEPRFQVVIKNLRYYHITPYVYRKVEYVAGDRVRQPKLNPILKQDVIILIDEEGNNLGEMDSKLALGIAQGRGIDVQQVGSQQKPVNNSIDKCILVFKMVGRTIEKTVPEVNVSNKKNLRKSSIEVVKEIHFGTKITEYDKLNKLRYIVDVLEKGKSVKIFSEVRAKGKYMSSEVYGEELKKRETILEDIEERLKDIGVREKELKVQGKMMYGHFKPSPEVLRRRTEALKERAENKMIMKRKKWEKKEETIRGKEKEGDEKEGDREGLEGNED